MPSASLNQYRIAPKRLNALARQLNGSKRYLEVGLQLGRTFEAVRASQKIGVDPRPLFNTRVLGRGVEVRQTTSRDFFAHYDGEPFDLIFLDGLHEAKETLSDLLQSLQLLKIHGFILIDDVLPSDSQSAIPIQAESVAEKKRAGVRHRRWYGDVWRVAQLAGSGLIPGIRAQLIGIPGKRHVQAVVQKMDDVELLEKEFSLAKTMFKFDYEHCVNDALSRSTVPDEVFFGRAGKADLFWTRSTQG